jgi:hypothetical protein
MEILNSGIFSLNSADSTFDNLLAGGLTGFGASLLLALVPSPEVLGGVIASATGVSKKETLKELGAEAEGAGIMDQVAVAKARGRRASRYVNFTNCTHLVILCAPCCEQHCTQV